MADNRKISIKKEKRLSERAAFLKLLGCEWQKLLSYFEFVFHLMTGNEKSDIFEDTKRRIRNDWICMIREMIFI